MGCILKWVTYINLLLTWFNDPTYSWACWASHWTCWASCWASLIACDWQTSLLWSTVLYMTMCLMVKWRRRHKDGMNKERGKECSEVSEQYNIGPLHTCPKQHMWEHAAICTHNCLDTPDFSFGTQLCMCSHVLFGTGAEWPGILYCLETSEHSFPPSPCPPSSINMSTM